MKIKVSLKYPFTNDFLKLVFVLILLIPFHVIAQKYADSIRINLSDPATKNTERIKALNQLAASLNSDSTNQALVYAHQAYLLSLNEKDKKLQLASLLNLSEGYLYNDIYDQALQYGYAALDICRNLKSEVSLANCYTNLGWIFYDTENASFSLQYHQQAYELFLKAGEINKVAVSLNAIGLVFQMKNENDSAKKYFKNALQIAREQKTKSIISAALNNIGICDNVEGKYKDAITHLQSALDVEGASNEYLKIAETQNQLAFSYLKLKKYPQADSLLKSSRELINLSTSNTRKEKLLDNLHISSQLYMELGDFKNAFENLKEYTKVSNEIITRNKSDIIATLKLKRETQEKENEINELNTQKELRSFQRNALAAGILLLIIIGFLLYSKLKQKQKRQKELDEMKQTLISQKLGNTLIEKDLLNAKLEYKNSDLKNYALYISQRNELIKEFIDELKDPGLSNEIKNDPLIKFNKVIRKFQQNLEINQDAQAFNLSVDEMHKDFFYNLLQKYPELTDNERRLCAQIRLNLSIKEIASLNNISVKSVEMARYRLRKHFNLHQNDNLNDFLKEF